MLMYADKEGANISSHARNIRRSNQQPRKLAPQSVPKSVNPEKQTFLNRI